MSALARLLDIPRAAPPHDLEHTLALLDDMRRQIDALGDISRNYGQLNHKLKQRKLQDIHLKLRDMRDDLAQRVVPSTKET
ncbi:MULTISPECIES: hypothetical protein [Lysobacteraceae]|uniref:hypothetical protein n=1 Tax=Lysobacteraceae TaxID=32033 RepID=UPI001C84D463|nr:MULTISPECIES: hypothetical protein [Xanthomonadaceae]MCF8869994.1 hypothetical protein [Xanthomonas campestris pv. campestris]MDH0071262.1 hypothetical protein [Stenotrophomonas maltophilia]MDH0104141.1 hypothetical protein [Stenotrophomonas maltophilia]MDH0330210.1 hypothetical protein [Stenotrophomonas maltophilia]MDH0740945.1 hypothetical protein [Stenotrophomonas maltophilia]